jgi:rubrerythrin
MKQDQAVREVSPQVSCFWCERLHVGESPLSVCPACAAEYSTMRLLEMRGSYPLERV